ncbi:tetratricopeptide repeat protein [Nonomuraea sp. NPDC003201]
MSGPEGVRRVHQRATGSGFARIYQAAGDMIVHDGGEPYRLAVWPAPAAAPPPEQARARPSGLLQAANGLIAFTGRRDLLDDLRRWRDGPGLAVRLIHGAGGQGKTRLAHEVARTWRQDGWVVLAAHHRRDRSAPEPFVVPDLARAAGVLLVVDYAERWDTADVLSLLADTRVGTGLPVRVLLLARPSGTWWQGLAYRIQRDVHLTPGRTELGPLEDGPDVTRAGLFDAARDRFAELLGIPDAGNVDPPPAWARHEAYRLVLTVHMAALAAVLAYDRGDPPPADPVTVSAFLLARERDHWEAMSAPSRDNPLRTTPDALGQLVYTATLTGRLGHADGRAALALAGIDSREAPGQLLKDHAVCYPGARDTVLEPLYPDRLGEDFVALMTSGHSHEFPADPWADGAPARLLAPAEEEPVEEAPVEDPGRVWAPHALATLVEAARRWPHLAGGQLYPLLDAYPELALQAGGATLAALAALDGIDPYLLEGIAAVLPDHRHIDLDIGIAAVTSRLAGHRLTATTEPALQARVHEDLAIRLGYAGLHARALAEGEQAVQIMRELAALDRARHLPNLAASLNNQATRLMSLGRRDEGLPLLEEAIAFRRELAAADPATHLPDLATALANHAASLADARRLDEALPHSEEALLLRRRLVALNPAAHLPNLPPSLINHALQLADMGRPAEAVLLSEEAVTIGRELAALNPAAYLPDLATALERHAGRLAEVGRLDEALPLSEESLTLCRELAELNRAAHLPDLSVSLNNHIGLLAQAGRMDEAIRLSVETIDVCRELADSDRRAYLPLLAASLHNYALKLVPPGREAEAVGFFSEAVSLRRELAGRDPAVRLPELVSTLRSLADLSSRHALRLVGEERRAEALPYSEVAVASWRELAELDRPPHLPMLASALNNHAGRLAEAGRAAEAAPVAGEAVALWREMVGLDRAEYLPDLALSLRNCALRLAEAGRRAEAVPLAQEAVVLYAQLAELDSVAHMPSYVQALTVLGLMLVEEARFREAVAPLLHALPASRYLPDRDRDIIITIMAQLYLAYAGDSAGVSREYRAITGQDVPGWMRG